MKTSRLSGLFLVLGSLLLTVWCFYPILPHLNQVLVTKLGDGIKNYFTYLFYIGYDSGTHFSGMNYPFGENVVFTDNMPILAWAIKGLSQFFPDITKYALGIFHTLMFSSLTIAAIFVYKILKLFHLPNSWAVIFSLLITYFSPQVFKMSGFFGMAFQFYLPALIYWLMSYHYTNKKKYPVYIAAITLIFTFLHLYNLAFTLFLIGFYIVAYLITVSRKTFKAVFQKSLPLIFSLLPAVLSLVVYFQVTDKITDRTKYPYGIFSATTTFRDLFVSTIAPLGNFLKFIFGYDEWLTEGYVYLGFIPIFFGAYLVVRLFVFSYNRLKKRTGCTLHPVRIYRIWLWMAIFELLISIYVPVNATLKVLADYLSVLRQFRSMGRFSWAFYYFFIIFFVLFVYRLYLWLKRKHYSRLARSMLFFLITVWSVQLYGYLSWLRNDLCSSAIQSYNDYFGKNGDGWVQWLNEKGLQPSQFQSILALPFFHIGSEKLWLQDNDDGTTMYYASQLSLQTGIPMVDVKMSRTSWSQTFAAVQLVDGPFAEKPILDSFSEKPLLVLVNTNFPLTTEETEWVNAGRLIGHRDMISVYRVTPSLIQKEDKRTQTQAIQKALHSSAQAGLIGEDTGFFYLQHWDGSNHFPAFQGAGAFYPEHPVKEEMIAKIKPHIEDTNHLYYNFSIWARCNLTDYRSPYFIIKEFNDQGQEIGSPYVGTKYSTHVIRDWFLVQKEIQLPKDISYLEVWVMAPDKAKSYIALDELAFWPANSVLYDKTPGGGLMLNNRPQNLRD